MQRRTVTVPCQAPAVATEDGGNYLTICIPTETKMFCMLLGGEGDYDEGGLFVRFTLLLVLTGFIVKLIRINYIFLTEWSFCLFYKFLVLVLHCVCKRETALFSSAEN